MLSSYQHAILSVILAQFTSKGFSDGMEGIVRLLEATPRLQVRLHISTVHAPGMTADQVACSHKF